MAETTAKLRVLVVDIHEATRDIMTEIIDEQFGTLGVVVDAVENSDSGWKQLDGSAVYDIIFIDQPLALARVDDLYDRIAERFIAAEIASITNYSGAGIKPRSGVNTEFKSIGMPDGPTSYDRILQIVRDRLDNDRPAPVQALVPTVNA
jgi:CheY-like chemotaxis protein